jgi:hypothetical protein
MAGPPKPSDVRRKLAWVAIVPLGVIGGLVGMVLIAPILRMHRSFVDDCLCESFVPTWELVRCGVITAAMTMAALFTACRHSEKLGMRTVALCSLFGWMNCAACSFVEAIIDANDLFDVAAAVFFAPLAGALLGLFFSLPFGVLYGLFLSPAMKSIGALRTRPTLDAFPRAVRTVSLTILSASLLAALAAEAQDNPLDDTVPPRVFLSVAYLAGAATLAAQIELHRMRRWLRSVARGEVEGWALTAGRGAAPPDLVALPPDPKLPDQTILERLPGGWATYRTTVVRIPWASVTAHRLR